MRAPFAFALVLTAVAQIAATTGASAQTEVTPAPVTAPSLAPTAPAAASSTSSTSSLAFPADPATRAAMLQTFDSLMVEQRRLGDETRSATLGALTPAHRAFVATLVGALATAAAPDPASTARQIDASLSLPERLAVLRVDADRRARERELLTRTSMELMARMSPDDRAALQRRVAEAQSDALRLTPGQRSVLVRDTKAYVETFAPGLATLGTPQSAGQMVLHALTNDPNALGR